MPTPTNAQENRVAAKIRERTAKAFYLGIAQQTEENGPIDESNWLVNYHVNHITSV